MRANLALAFIAQATMRNKHYVMGINAFRASLGEVLPTQGLCNSQGSLTPPKWA